MAVLVLDTAARFCSVCLFDETAGEVVAAIEDEIGRGHAERLMDTIEAVMAKAGTSFDALSGIAVTIGPGSFTGIRVGVAAARGFALARGLPVTGVTTLETIAMQALSGTSPDGPLAVLIGGGRGQIFLQHFASDGTALDAPSAVPEQDAGRHVRNDCALLAGDAAERAGLDLPRTVDRPVGTIEAVARAAQRYAHPPSPLYLRGADAKPQQGSVLPRRMAGAAVS